MPNTVIQLKENCIVFTSVLYISAIAHTQKKWENINHHHQL